MPFNPFHFGEKLFQQYCVDTFIRIQWIKDNQKKLQADNYNGVNRILEKLAENEETNVKRKVILPSTFFGSPRFYSEYYEDAMTLVCHYGMPDFFHTMTCATRTGPKSRISHIIIFVSAALVHPRSTE